MSATAEDVTPALDDADLFETALRLGDRALIIGQQLSAWTSHGPTVELDIALQNHALDLIGQARLFLDYAGRLEGKGRDEDKLAYFRQAHEFRNCLLVEQPNGDFAQTMLRQLFYATYARALYAGMEAAGQGELAEIAAKAEREMAYHVRHAGEWVVRLGDGTDESRRRCEAGLAALWPYVHELFVADEVDQRLIAAGVLPLFEAVKAEWMTSISSVLERATLAVPEDDWTPSGGRQGQHSERLSYILGEMQSLARSDPEAKW